ncbi:MAG: hypothetical protein CMJ64_04605 [Planctomycetaceae bacterium]|nr:hypothetical protein [Planctomycetaceae bacterium]
MITSTIQPDSWDQVGGPGAIEHEYASMSLVISQTWHVHRQIEPLLTTLREARDKQGISPHRTMQTISKRSVPFRPIHKRGHRANIAGPRMQLASPARLLQRVRQRT